VGQIAIALLSVAVTAGSLFAANTKKAPVPGTDDLSRYVAAQAPTGGQTTLRDASGRTLGTASTVIPSDGMTEKFNDSQTCALGSTCRRSAYHIGGP